jgi:hypothetical protein
MRTGSAEQATIASRAARGLPPGETRDEALDRFVKDFQDYDAQMSPMFEDVLKRNGFAPQEIIDTYLHRKKQYESREALEAAKKMALVAVLVVSGLTLGPAIAASLKAGAGAAGVAAGSKAAAIIPMAQNVINGTRTVVAVANGEAPPPPLSIEGGSFLNWSSSLGSSLLKQEIADKQLDLNEQQAAAAEHEMALEIQRLQQEAYNLGLSDASVTTPTGVTNPTMLALMNEDAQKKKELLMIAGAGLGVVVLLGLLNRG